MGVPQAMAAVEARASSIRDALHKSQTITDSMVAILGSFDHRLSALETAMRPTQVPLSLALCLFPEKPHDNVTLLQYVSKIYCVSFRLL